MTWEEEVEKAALKACPVDQYFFKAGADWAIRESSLVKGLVEALYSKQDNFCRIGDCDCRGCKALAHYAAEINRK